MTSQDSAVSRAANGKDLGSTVEAALPEAVSANDDGEASAALTAAPVFEAIELRDNGVEVTHAPEYAMVSLELLANSDHRALRLHNGQLVLGLGPTTSVYRVIGWSTEHGALEVQRVD